jgi:putative aldouronate transport system permease protein
MAKWLAKLRRQYVLVILALAAIGYLIVFKYLSIFGWVFSFMDYRLGTGPGRGLDSKWVGLANFRTLFGDSYFWLAVRNTLVISSLRIIVSFAFGIFVALVINEIRATWFKKTVQTVSYLPHFVSWVEVSTLTRNILGMDGIFNQMRGFFGASQPLLLMQEKGFFYALTAITYVWKEAGWDAIIFLAAIAGIDATLYEAAVIDGAGRIKRIVHITVPAIVPVVIVLLILQVGQILNTGFEQMFLLQTPPTSGSAEVLDLYMYRVAFSGTARFSLATAAAMLKAVVGVGMAFAANTIANRFGKGVKL